VGRSSAVRRFFGGFLDLVFSRDRDHGDQPDACAFLILGLGNPGREYEGTRHNIGYRVVNEIADRHGSGRWIDRGDSFEQAAAIDGRPIVLVRPLTFMNRSGQAAIAALERHPVALEDVLVIIDDIDLPLGRLRLKASGGPGTHNGLRDIVNRMGPGFARLRVGIKGDEPCEDLAGYVLSSFDDDQMSVVEESVRRAADGVESVVAHGVNHAMGTVNRRSVSPPRSP
jgi:PTH1 family peptidyl-tRNA hydrolase